MIGNNGKQKIFSITISFLMIIISFGSILLITINSHNDGTANAEVVVCFVAGTKISMADGSLKNIEDAQVGDMVLTVNMDTMEVEPNRVYKLASPVHNDMVRLVFEDVENKNTFDHPYYVKDKGWCSYKPSLTKERYELEANQLEIGDICYVLDEQMMLKETELLGISEEWGDVQTYNLYGVENNHNFFANGVLVHNKEVTCLPAGTEITMADGSLKNIEDVVVDDTILSYDVINSRYIDTVVIDLHTPVREGVWYINDGFIRPTCDHPFFVKKPDGEVGWASIDPGLTKIVYPSIKNNIMQLEIGDMMYDLNGDWIKIKSLEYHEGSIQTYTFNVDANDLDANNYFANGVLTHNGCIPDPPPPDANPTVTGFSPTSSTWTNSLSITVGASDDNGLSAYAYEWTTTTQMPLTFDDGTGSLSGTSDSFTASAPGGDGTWYLHAVVEDGARQYGYDYSGTYSYDSVDPTGSVVIDDGESYTASTSVDLRLEYGDPSQAMGDSSGIDGVNYSNSQHSSAELSKLAAAEGWETAGAEKSWTLSSGDGSKTVYYYIKDNAGNIYETTDAIILDITDPTGSVSINSGDTYTDLTSVTLGCLYSDATSGVNEVRYSNDGSSWSSWEAASASKSWTLSSGDGSKTVYYEVQDNAGNTVQETDTINFDGTDPSASVTINDGNSTTTSTSVTLNCSYSDAYSGVDQVRYSNDGSSWSSWEAASASKSWTLGSDGTSTVYYEVKDNAGNTLQATDTITLDTTAPSISASPSSDILDEANSYINPSVGVDISMEDETSTPDVYRYVWSDGTDKPSTGWSGWVSVLALLTISNSTPGRWYLHVDGKDDLGNLGYKYFGPYDVNPQPTASFTKTSSSINVGQTVTLDASGSTDDGSISEYAWDLNGDGTFDIYGSSITYTFNVSYSYSIQLRVTDDDGATHTSSDSIDVNDICSFDDGWNFFVYRRNASATAKELANFLNLQDDEIIVLFNDSTGICDWDDLYLVGTTPDESDFTILRYDVVKIYLNPGRSFSKDFGICDTDSTYVSRTLKYTTYDLTTNHGYTVIPWIKEGAIRASTLADSISPALSSTYTVSIYKSATDTYVSYLKLPGNPTAYENAHIDNLDPLIQYGDAVIIKVPSGTEYSFDTSLIAPPSTATDDSSV